MSTISRWRFLLLGLVIILFNGITTSAQNNTKFIVAIINSNTRRGKEEKISMEIALDAFNNASNNLSLYVVDSAGGKPLRAALEVADLIKKMQVEAIIGSETWSQAALVAEVANETQVPMLSFASPSVAPPIASLRWPFLVKMASNDTLQIKCIASIVGSYRWTRVIAIYEDSYVTDSGFLTLLSEELQIVGSDIEHWLTFPAYSSLSDPKTYIHNELVKLDNKQSRVFVLVGSSLELAYCILTEAKRIGLVGNNSVWITTDSVANLLSVVNSTVISTMQGLIGLKTYFSETIPSYIDFSVHFRNLFQSFDPKDPKPEPGFYALRAYDTVYTVALAIEGSSINKNINTSQTLLLENILASNFTGLSGNIQFQDRELSCSTTYEIVNVVGRTYPTLKFWSLEHGFSDGFVDERDRETTIGGGDNRTMHVLGARVYWPGGLERVPLGWKTPTETEPLIIGVPGNASFEDFVRVKNGEDPVGLSIDVFNEVVKLLNYDLPHRFVPFFGSHDELLQQVYLKNFGAAVGDITVLANRLNFVDFTEPYADSGLSMVVPVRRKSNAWSIVKPFTTKLWIMISILFLYIAFVVWFLERRSNPDFGGPWKNQLSAAIWFTCSTLFFSQRGNIHSNFTRVVIFFWLFTVFVMTSSYISSLTSMLTVTELDRPKTLDGPIGCNSPYVRRYLESVLHVHPKNIMDISSEYEYISAFKKGIIKAALLELPYQRVFLSKYPKDYEELGPRLRSAGLGFAFPKGSPMTEDFSKAILSLYEDGELNILDQYWSTLYDSSNSDSDNHGLDLSNFKALFMVTFLVSTVMLVLYAIAKVREVWRVPICSPSVATNMVWGKMKRILAYFCTGQFHHSHSNSLERSQHSQSTPLRVIDMPETHMRESNIPLGVLELAHSFPGRNGRVDCYSYERP
ncbi:hypothetical protein ACHQM5_021027 [Ranunculus cassubicifolius]